MQNRPLRCIVLFFCLYQTPLIQAADFRVLFGYQYSNIAIPSSRFTKSNVGGKTKEAGMILDLSDNIHISLKRIESAGSYSYKVGERELDWLDRLFGNDDTGVYAHVGKEIQKFSLSSTFNYPLKTPFGVYSSLGISKWKSRVKIGDPYSDNFTETKSGTGYNYGFGFTLTNRRRISFSGGVSRHRLKEITLTTYGITAEYKF